MTSQRACPYFSGSNVFLHTTCSAVAEMRDEVVPVVVDEDANNGGKDFRPMLGRAAETQ